MRAQPTSPLQRISSLDAGFEFKIGGETSKWPKISMSIIMNLMKTAHSFPNALVERDANRLILASNISDRGALHFCAGFISSKLKLAM